MKLLVDRAHERFGRIDILVNNGGARVPVHDIQTLTDDLLHDEFRLTLDATANWDVRDMADVVAGSFKLVQKEILTEPQYGDFVCRNPFRLFTESNPQFFDGTVLEAYARHQLLPESSG